MIDRPSGALSCVVLLLLLAVGCSTPGDARDARDARDAVASAVPDVRDGGVSEERNDTDLAYTHELGAMHTQAVSMVAMIANKEVSAEVRDLAGVIGRSRSAEFEQLRVLLRSWEVQPHGEDYHGNPGELTIEQLSALYSLDGTAFERAWLERMTDNHRGAVAMSRSEVDRGLNPDAREFARGLIRVQEAHLMELERLMEE